MPVTAAIFRRLAVSLPAAYESAHMGHPDFRIASPDSKGRIFATLSAEASGKGVLNLTLEQQAAFIEELPEVFEPVQGGWGRMGMTYVHLDRAGQDVLLGALTTAHRNVMAKLEANSLKPKAGKPKSAPLKKPAKKAAKKTGPRSLK